ncbi:transposase [Streptomyces sp. NBC_00212]|uniref:transposase n=1 Tax=Streptomyces sp. NBC_00212 TaxID=2975684 RepID=UPI00386DE4AA
MRDDRGRTESLNGRRITSESAPRAPESNQSPGNPAHSPPHRPDPDTVSAWSSAERRIATRKSASCHSPASSTQASTCSGVGSSGRLGIAEHIRVVQGQADHHRTPRGRPGGEPQSHLTTHAPTRHPEAEVDASARHHPSRLRRPGSTRSAPAELLRVRPDRAWIGDITYLPLVGGMRLYLSTVIDVYSRRLLGWSMAGHMRTELVTNALDMTVRVRGGLVDGVIFRGDHGAPYGAKAFADTSRRAGIRRSMGAVDTSADNAAAESFIASPKRRSCPADGADRPNEPASSRSPAGSASTTTSAGTPRSAASPRSPSKKDQLRWPALHDNRCPRSWWQPRLPRDLQPRQILPCPLQPESQIRSLRLSLRLEVLHVLASRGLPCLRLIGIEPPWRPTSTSPP